MTEYDNTTVRVYRDKMKELIKKAKEFSDKGGDAWPKFLRLGYFGVCIGVGVLFTGINLFIGNEVAWITVFIIWFLLYKVFKLMERTLNR